LALAALAALAPFFMSARSPILITVFTGYLGSGKTSIILSLLPKLPHDYIVVLLKNEFGDVEGLYNKKIFRYPGL
jgi:Ni2+-binding GTPase involved in maturation of urease and hydrogenase